ncbi:hypothetical protein [Deinococcus sp.]|uniref:hypothetical protein n=1 Tax=Deinococcus sp. TaxID=47478 RepID=UPI003CC5F946
MTLTREQPVPPTTAAGREALEDVPGLERHRGPGPELILRWNQIPVPAPSVVDVALHFHGFSGHGAAMNTARDKEGASGLDFADPRSPAQPGRTRPTLGLLPRGHYYGGRSGAGYDFPELVRPGRVRALIDWSLEHWSRIHLPGSPTPALGRLVLSAHSGGGAALWQVLDELDPHEVYVFDALYQSPARLLRWARSRIARDAATGLAGGLEAWMRQSGGALRVLYTSGGGTAGNSLEAQRHLQDLLAPASALQPWYRVERTPVAHGEVPRRYGWQLLADAAAELV